MSHIYIKPFLTHLNELFSIKFIKLINFTTNPTTSDHFVVTLTKETKGKLQDLITSHTKNQSILLGASQNDSHAKISTRHCNSSPAFSAKSASAHLPGSQLSAEFAHLLPAAQIAETEAEMENESAEPKSRPRDYTAAFVLSP